MAVFRPARSFHTEQFLLIDSFRLDHALVMARQRQMLFDNDAWRVVLSSCHDEWETPQDLFDRFDAEFHFALDACATEKNAKCAAFFTAEQDGLRQAWRGTVWCNPPFARQIGRWVKKAYESSKAGATVVMLIPARTDTVYWHEFVSRAAEVRFLRGRVKFGGARTGAPFPSAVVVFRPTKEQPTETSAIDPQLPLFSYVPARSEVEGVVRLDSAEGA